MTDTNLNYPDKLVPQHQAKQPGEEAQMNPVPEFERADHWSAKRLIGKVALITGGDSGIGRAVAYAFAKEGADIAILYLEENEDAQTTKNRVEEIGRRCYLMAGDAGNQQVCHNFVEQVMKEFGHIDILVNNCAEQHIRSDLKKINEQELLKTFRTNIFSYFYMVEEVMPYLKKGASIINTASVVAYKGNPQLLDYAATKGAIIALTRSLSTRLIEKGIRVNAVAPGPIWTPLIPATFPPEKVAEFGQQVPMKRPGQPSEVAPSFVFLASEDASYISGQTLHPNGGVPVGG